MEIKYSGKAQKQLKKICKGDRKSAILIMSTIESYAKGTHADLDIKVLKGKYGEFKRIRAGKYRIIFDEEKNVMMIYEIKHRQEAYHD